MMSDEEQGTNEPPFSEEDINMLQDALERARASASKEGMGAGAAGTNKIIVDPDDPYHYDGS